MKKSVCIIDTSFLCVWLQVPGKETCGSPPHNYFDYEKVDKLIQTAIKNDKKLVLPLATIIETGNHITQAAGNTYPFAQKLVGYINAAMLAETPWIYFGDQVNLWNETEMSEMLNEWITNVSSKVSIGDISIKKVADYYATAGFVVEIFTGDAALKAHEIPSFPIPRRKQL
jgi:hypothetical protein